MTGPYCRSGRFEFQSFSWSLYRTLWRASSFRVFTARAVPRNILDLQTAPSRVIAFCGRHYAVLAAAVLGLAALNLAFRLGSEVVSEWDESLYAISAWEMGKSGNLIATTFLGTLDYYNTKPPLNIWLIALSFKAFGVNLVSLRLVSVISAWLTVAVLQAWARRAFGAAVALVSGLVLATTFGFVFAHSGRTAETDALFTLLTLLTVVVLWAEEKQPWHRAWLGPIAAAVFLLRGMAVLMPVGIVLAVLVGRNHPPKRRWLPTISALVLFVVPVGAWAIARWSVDRWLFFDRLFNYDFIARSLTVIEEHPGGPLYYFNILQRDQYDWLVVGIVALVLFPLSWQRVRDRLMAVWRGDDGLGVLLGSWVGVTLLIPTVMRTKLPWYLNPFYPAFALGIAWLLVRALSSEWTGLLRRRQMILGAVVVVAFGVAEGKVLWYPSHYRNVSDSAQGLLLQEKARLRKHQIFQDHWDRAEIFVVSGVLGAERRLAGRVETFWRESQPGDCLISAVRLTDPGLVPVRSGRHHALYCRAE
jgi:4-amino-4-deoxy-L-arabinose transferase-like glycosyltransferase